MPYAPMRTTISNVNTATKTLSKMERIIPMIPVCSMYGLSIASAKLEITIRDKMMGSKAGEEAMFIHRFSGTLRFALALARASTVSWRVWTIVAAADNCIAPVRILVSTATAVFVKSSALPAAGLAAVLPAEGLAACVISTSKRRELRIGASWSRGVQAGCTAVSGSGAEARDRPRGSPGPRAISSSLASGRLTPAKSRLGTTRGART
mmetsp:Transcript_33749/g.101917  ORF Transcript_33749/g.101917 Transcript_33749/m.101917 type:complete len:208 (-) Transcript_33749:161-784(-)